MEEIINKYLILISKKSINEIEISTKYLSLFLSKFNGTVFLDKIFELFIKIVEEDRILELDTNIIEYIISEDLSLADYDILFFFNIVFFPKDYQEKYKDDFFFDLTKFCYSYSQNKVKSTHKIIKMFEMYHNYLKLADTFNYKGKTFYNAIATHIMCFYWLNNDRYTLEDFNSLFNDITKNISYYNDYFLINGFYDPVRNTTKNFNNLNAFINTLFTKEGKNNGKRI